MSSWGNEQQQYMMQNMMGMNPMMPNMMPPPGNIPPLMPPMFGPPPGAMPFGVPPPKTEVKKSVEEKPKDQNRDPRMDNKDHTKQRDLTIKRSNQQDNDHNNKNEKNKNRKKSKWDSTGNENNWQSQQHDNPSLPGPVPYGPPGPANMMMPPNMIPYGPTGPMMPPPMDMSNMPNMSAMPGMPNMMPGMNMMMMNPAMPVGAGNQPIYVSNAALLPPLPNTQLPNRSEKPPGCKTIFIGGFPANVTKEIINEMFARFGTIADIKLNKQGVAQVRFESTEPVDQAFFFSGSRFRYVDQMDAEATMIFIDYATNSEDQVEQDKNKLQSSRFEPCTPAALNSLSQKIKNDAEFAQAAPTLEGWLQRGDCNRTNANTFYNLIQASNSHLRRLYSEKIKVDEEYHSTRSSLKEKFSSVLKQFELIAKILIAAKHQHVSECFSRQQKKNIEMWLKMTEVCILGSTDWILNTKRKLC